MAYNFGEGEPKSGGNNVKLIQNTLFPILLPIFGIGAANWSSEKFKEGVRMFQGQTGEIPLLSLGKLGLFLVLALFFHPFLPKLGTPTQLKLLFRIGIKQGYPLKKFRLDNLKITVSVSNCKKAVFTYVFCKSHEKHLVIEWLPW